MDLPRPGRVALALLLASTAVAAAFLYGELLHGSERHSFGGVSGNQPGVGNATLIVDPLRARPGDIVRIETDSAPRFDIGLDLYAVPAGQARWLLAGNATILLHVPAPTQPRDIACGSEDAFVAQGPAGEISNRGNVSVSCTFFPNTVDVSRHVGKQFTVPQGGAELAWMNRTHPPAGAHGINVALTIARGEWLAVQPAFVALELALVAGALLTLSWPSRRPPAESEANPTSQVGVPDVAVLLAASGRHLGQLRNTMAAAGLFLLVAVLMGRQVLWRMLDERVGVWAPGTQSLVQACFSAAAIAVLLCWGLMAYRVQRQLSAWRRHMAKNPLA